MAAGKQADVLVRVIIRYKLVELIKSCLCREGTSLSAMLQAYVGSRTLRSRSRVLSMTGRCTWPMYYQGIVSLEK